MKTKIAGTWRTGVPKVKIGGVWKTALVWTKVSGTWRCLVPGNMVQLSFNTSYSGSGQICNGINGSPNLIGTYLFQCGSNNSALQSGGSSLDHSGSLHGQCPATETSSVATSHAGAKIGFTSGVSNSLYSHSHTMPAHSHTGTATGIVFYNISIIPIIGDPIVRANTIFLADVGITALAGMTDITATYPNRYITLSATGGVSTNGNFENHHLLHGVGADVYSSEYYLPNLSQLQPNETTYGYGHRHVLTHYMESATNSNGYTIKGPVSHKYRAFKLNADTYFNDLPSGTKAFFTSTDVPIGWTASLPDPGRYIKITSSATALDEADSHNHYRATFTQVSQSISNKAVENYAYNNPHANEWYMPDHQHSWTDNHSGNVSLTPPYVALVLATKN